MWFKLLFLILCCSAVHCSRFPKCVECRRLTAQIGTNANLTVKGVREIVYGVCELNTKDTNKTCRKTFDTVQDAVYYVSAHLFPKQTIVADRTFTCSHLLKICPDKDEMGHILPSNAISCKSCNTLFNMIITLLKDSIKQLNNKAADVLCVGASESCRSQFRKIVKVVDPVWKIFNGTSKIKTVCKDVMKCK